MLSAAPVAAQDYGDTSGKTLIATADLRLAAADGERSWLEGGLGKTRFGPGGDRLVVPPRAIEGTLVFQPQLSWSLGMTIAAVAQDGQEHPVDLSEAYLDWRHDPIGTLKLSGRAGLLWPPVSLEHGGADWSVTDTITPSALNSWIGEEVKVGAAEGSASLPLAGGRLTATAALFGFNDTAGTLLAFRGWALSDEKATAFGHQPLPPLDAFMHFAQAPATRPVIELDDRPGFYLRLGWSVATRLALHAFYYDNRGDPQAVDADRQWGWRTRFAEIGASIGLGTSTRLTTQAMTGTTQMGYPMAGRIWVDTRFSSAYALLSRTIGGNTLSGRIEAFGTHGHGSVLGSDESEDGWAATLAAKHRFGTHVSVLGEALHVDSKRAARDRSGLAPDQSQTVLQLAVRLHS